MISTLLSIIAPLKLRPNGAIQVCLLLLLLLLQCIRGSETMHYIHLRLNDIDMQMQ